MDSIPAWTPTLSEAEQLIPRVGRAYGLDVIEWRGSGNGLLLAVGSGLMMATMDACLSLRWAVDIGGGKVLPKLPDALTWFDRLASVIVVHAWYSITPPVSLRAALPRVSTARLIVRSNVDLGVESLDSFGSLIDSVSMVTADVDVLSIPSGTGGVTPGETSVPRGHALEDSPPSPPLLSR